VSPVVVARPDEAGGPPTSTSSTSYGTTSASRFRMVATDTHVAVGVHCRPGARTGRPPSDRMLRPAQGCRSVAATAPSGRPYAPADGDTMARQSY